MFRYFFFCRLLEDVGMCLRYSALLHASRRAVKGEPSAIFLCLAQRKSATSSCYQLAQLEIHVVVTRQRRLESPCAWMSTEHTIMGFTNGLFQLFLAIPCLWRSFTLYFGVWWPSGELLRLLLIDLVGQSDSSIKYFNVLCQSDSLEILASSNVFCQCLQHIW